MKTLYLMRHAKAEQAASKEEDINRNLSVPGREACEVVGVYMKNKGYNPGLVLCSAASRTRETFEMVMKYSAIAPQYEFLKELYNTTAEELIRRLRFIDDDVESVMIVGHNPVMHNLAMVLAQPGDGDLRMKLELKYPTGALTVLRFEVSSWNGIVPGNGKLLDFMVPSVS